MTRPALMAGDKLGKATMAGCEAVAVGTAARHAVLAASRSLLCGAHSPHRIVVQAEANGSTAPGPGPISPDDRDRPLLGHVRSGLNATLIPVSRISFSAQTIPPPMHPHLPPSREFQETPAHPLTKNGKMYMIRARFGVTSPLADTAIFPDLLLRSIRPADRVEYSRTALDERYVNVIFFIFQSSLARAEEVAMEICIRCISSTDHPDRWRLLQCAAEVINPGPGQDSDNFGPPC
jgi:hypothetical protein